MLNFHVNIPSLVTLFAILAIVGCDTSSSEYFYTEGGLKYKYQDIVVDGKIPQIGDVLTIKMKWSTSEDSVFYFSDKESFNGSDFIKLNKPKHPGGIEEGLAKLIEGDSVTFYIHPKRFFEDYVNAEVPYFLKGDTEMRIDIRLIEIQNKEEYEDELKEWQRAKEFEEFQEIEKTLVYWKESGDSVIMIGGLYIVYDAVKEAEVVMYNDLIELHYVATFTNGEEFYSTYNNGAPDEFQFGKTGQMVEGLTKAISVMKYGQKAKVLIPSDIGFKEKGSVGNIVPPYTPVIYYLEILPKKGEGDLFY